MTAWDPNATPPLDPNDASGNWGTTPAQVRRTVWAGWLRLAELEADPNDPNDANRVRPLRQFTWGLDLSQTLAGAGGIGGLLGSLDLGADPNSPADDRRLLFFYDGNGNVVQLVDAAADPNDPNGLAARYEYDAYGAVTAQAGSYAATNAVRFSTKPFEERMGLGDWGRRWYSAELGRWVSWDPIFEGGGANLYGYAANQPSRTVDAIGQDFGIGEALFAGAFLIASAVYANAPGPGDPDYTGISPDGLTAMSIVGGVSSVYMGIRIFVCGGRIIGLIPVAAGTDIAAAGALGTPTLANQGASGIARSVLPSACDPLARAIGTGADLLEGGAAGIVIARNLGGASAFSVARRPGAPCPPCGCQVLEAQIVEGGPLFRGTTVGWPGNPGLTEAGITPATTDPLVGTLFATESANYGRGVVHIARRSAFADVRTGMTNVSPTKAALEAEHAVGVVPVEFARRADLTISVEQSQQILTQMGYGVPASLDKASLEAYLRHYSQRLSRDEIAEYVRRACANSAMEAH